MCQKCAVEESNKRADRKLDCNCCGKEHSESDVLRYYRLCDECAAEATKPKKEVMKARMKCKKCGGPIEKAFQLAFSELCCLCSAVGLGPTADYACSANKPKDEPMKCQKCKKELLDMYESCSGMCIDCVEDEVKRKVQPMKTCLRCKKVVTSTMNGLCQQCNLLSMIEAPVTGWRCPVCGAGNAPWKQRCDCRATATPTGPYVPPITY